MEQSTAETTKVILDLLHEQGSLARTPENAHKMLRALIRGTGALAKEVEENRKELLRLRRIVENRKG